MSDRERAGLDPLAAALRQKARDGAAGALAGRLLAAGDGWRAVDVVCTCGPRDRPYFEQHALASVSLVLAGTFACRGRHGPALLAAGSLFLVAPGETLECSHRHGEGDRCLSFQFEPGLFERVSHDAGAAHAAFGRHSLPPLRTLAPISARARRALSGGDAWQEIALELAGAVLRAASPKRAKATARDHHDRIARVLRLLTESLSEPHTLESLAAAAHLSPYHFLRTFKGVTGVTPHQWLLRARLAEAADRLATTRDSVTAVALDSGFDDLSNFMRSFRAEFGASPRRYRLAA